MNLRPWIHSLDQLFRSSEPYIPLNNNVLETVKTEGLAYHLVPLLRPRGDNSWFENTLICREQLRIAEAAELPRPDFNKSKILYLVNWSYLLWQARPGARSATTPLARQLLFGLIPLIEAFDFVLGTDLRVFQRNYEATELLKRAADPDYFGQTGDEDEARFKAHLRSLLENKVFRRYYVATMRKSLRLVTAAGDEHRIGLCTNAKSHGRRTTCDYCKPQRWLREAVSLLKPTDLSEPALLHRLKFEVVMPDWYSDITARWPAEIRYVLACAEPSDGAYRVKAQPRYGEIVLVNWAKLARRATEQDRVSVLREFYMPDAPAAHRFAGGRARMGFQNVYGAKVLAQRPKELKQMVVEAGWEWFGELDTPYELYRVGALAGEIAKDKKALQALSKARRVYVDRSYLNSQKKRIYVTRAWNNHLIHVFRRRKVYRKSKRNKLGFPGPDAPKFVIFFQLPFDVPPPPKTWNDRRKLAVKLGEKWLWTTKAINNFANEQVGETFVYPEAREFLNWALMQETELLDPKRWRRALYDHKLHERLAELNRGPNVRQHLGPFAESEQRIIEAFLSERKDADGKPKRSKLSEGEWGDLMVKLPGRDKLGIQRQIDKQGLKFAQANGWRSYTQSYWGLVRTENRRTKWAKKGVKA